MAILFIILTPAHTCSRLFPNCASRRVAPCNIRQGTPQGRLSFCKTLHETGAWPFPPGNENNNPFKIWTLFSRYHWWPLNRRSCSRWSSPLPRRSQKLDPPHFPFSPFRSQWLIRVKTEKKFTGAKIGAIFCKITSQITTKNWKSGHEGFLRNSHFCFFPL